MDSPAAPADVDRLRRRLSRWLAGAAVALLIALALAGLAARRAGGVAPGVPAPRFDLALLTGDGRVTNADLAGRVAVVNVWASWCPPCRDEAPALQRVYASSDAARVAFLGVAHDDTAHAARGFLDRFHVGYASALDDGSFGAAYGVRGLPTTYVIAADGTLVSRHFGPIGETELRALIASALARPAATPAPGASATAPAAAAAAAGGGG